jgi:catalase
MATKKNKNGGDEGAGSILSTVSAPSTGTAPTTLQSKERQKQRLLEKMTAGQAVAAGMPQNPTKAGEYGETARMPQPGASVAPPSPLAGASTTSENIASGKVGAGVAPVGASPVADPLDRVRSDATGQTLTTNQGVAVADNQHSLKVGLRGPTALEDFILREKITHFDHERIPERVVHARGSAAHGYFEAYQDFSKVTRAAPFAAAGKQTPVFVRFSTVAGERGSTDTARDVRGFAVKFYTDEGNWDLVGNNMPVFFIQDAMKFPDLVHAVKPEPNNAIPQASSAHDTFWDFASLSPESVHMMLWTMSDRALPRSFRMMQGFGVHSYRMVNAEGVSVFVKFHWTPAAGTRSLFWDEAVKISGADPDFHRRDLWEAIEAGVFPEWELALQIFTEEQAAGFGFDILDSTKLIPEELVPLTPVGKMVLNRNPDNFFAETEQVAFCVAHVVPGIDFSNDPLLQGRIHSYLDTQITRLGGVNFHEIPINSPVAPVYNNQRDGHHRQAIHRGRVAYEPNSLAGGSPAQAGYRKGFTTFPEHIVEDKVRGKAELFADHYSQARLFWQSQSTPEKQHIVKAFRFELSRVQTLAVRERVISLLMNVADELAQGVASGLGMPLPEAAPVLALQPLPAYEPSPPLSLLHFPGDGSIKTRRVAILVANGIEAAAVRSLYTMLLAEGAVPRLVGPLLGQVMPADGDALNVEVSVEAMPSVLYDAVVVPAGETAISAWMNDLDVMDFLRDQYRHGKPMLMLGGASALLQQAGIPSALPDGSADDALLLADAAGGDAAFAGFKTALAGFRQAKRDANAPPV